MSVQSFLGLLASLSAGVFGSVSGCLEVSSWSEVPGCSEGSTFL